MLPLTIGLFSSILIAFLAIRFGIGRADNWLKLLRYAAVTTMCALILLMIGIAFSSSGRAEREATTLPVLTTLTDALDAEKAGEAMTLQGQVSQSNAEVNGTGYVAYVGFDENGNAEYELPRLLVELEGGAVEVEQAVYQQFGWREGRSAEFSSIKFLSPNDEVIVYGRGYLGQSERDGESAERLFLSAPFVFQGGAAEFENEVGPTFQRIASLARIGTLASLISAVIILFSPLPQGLQLIRSR